MQGSEHWRVRAEITRRHITKCYFLVFSNVAAWSRACPSMEEGVSEYGGGRVRAWMMACQSWEEGVSEYEKDVSEHGGRQDASWSIKEGVE